MNNITHKILFLMLLSTCCLDCMSQSIDANYVMQRSMTDSVSSIVAINYYDGLGRKSQTVIKDAATNGYDQITMTDYDIKGKVEKNWLTIPINGNGAFCDTILFRQTAIDYYSDSFPYLKINYEDSPLNRKTEEYGAGIIWHNNHKSKKIVYSANSSTINKCRKYVVSTSDYSLSSQGYWQNGELDVIIETDEDNSKVISFKDMRGLLVLQRIIDNKNSNQEHDTYYVYDNRGNLCYVLPPMASSELTSGTWSDNNETIQKYCYFYKYDGRGLCIYKRSPDCAPVFMRYDKAHRLIFLQDGNLRDKGKWLYKLYDIMGRNVVTGICSNANPPDFTYEQVQAIFAKSTLSFSSYYRDSCGYIANVALNEPEPLSVNYYDKYNFISIFATHNDSLQFRQMTGYDERYNNLASQSAKGYLTGTATRVLGDTTVLVKSLYYDCHGNVIQSHESNAVGGYDHDYMHLTFTGKPLIVRHEHSTDSTHHVDINTMTYDAMERLLSTTVTHDGEQVDVITNTYDDLGRLASQSCLSNQQTTSYSYNIRNWITSIDAGECIMKQSLHYADAVDGSTPCYNGNISAMDWNTEINNFDMKLNRYCYSYDGMNRLTEASYMMYYPMAGMGFNNQENYSTSYSYDLNSNITALQRYGRNEQFGVGSSRYYGYGLIDNLTITRNGNQLKKVTDQCEVLTYAGAMDFKDGANEQVEYTWDANGNMTSDKNKGLTQIKYNVLNLPEKIIHSDGHVTYITYAADGRKLNVTYKIDLRHAIVGPGGLTGLDGNEYGLNGGGVVDPVHPGLDPIYTDFERVVMTRDYCGNYIYRNGAIERIMMGNGFIQDSVYYVQIKDYQGNVRAVLDQNRNLVERNEYYPYGGLINASDNQHQPYKYSSKELDRENGLDLYDFSARMYDPMLPMFTSVDPLSEKKPRISPFVYCSGNPVNRIDPTGFDDYRFDKKTGAFYLMGLTDQTTDRVLAYHFNKKTKQFEQNTGFFQRKVLMDNIEKGILEDGINFKENNIVISVGENKASVDGVKSFVLKMSELVGKEIKGFCYSSNSTNEVSDILINKYKHNTYTSSYGNTNALAKKYIDNFSLDKILITFHTHPNGELGATFYAPEISTDIEIMTRNRQTLHNARFIILYRSQGQDKPQEYDYTEE